MFWRLSRSSFEGPSNIFLFIWVMFSQSNSCTKKLSLIPTDINLSKNDSTSLCSSGGVRCKMSDVAFSPCRGFSLEIVLFPKGKSHHRTRIAQTLSPVNYTSIVVLFRSFNTHWVPEVCVRVCQIQRLHCFTWAYLWCTDMMMLLLEHKKHF